MHASDCETRSAPEVFVPPNDPSTSRARTAQHVMPASRARQPRRFPAARPDDPMMHMLGDRCPEHGNLERLNALAQDVTCLGHSSSLVRCRFRRGDPPLRHPRRRSRTRLYRGRLRELTGAHAANPVRPAIPAAAPNPPPPPARPAVTTAPLVLEAIGEAPDILASAVVCRQLRRTLMGGYRRTAGERLIPEEVSGHAPDGSPTRAPHLAIQPMAFVGHPPTLGCSATPSSRRRARAS